jgi:indole-3-glycerol phosphate synthase
MILQDIVANKKLELSESKNKVPLENLLDEVEQIAKPLDLAQTLAGPGLNLIAEIKKASPSRGVICRNFNPVSIAKTYAANKASAISVLTEVKYFQGSLKFLEDIRNVLGDARPPLIRKDFIIDPYQVYESRVAGADSILLIVAVLTPPDLEELINISRFVGMEPLVEVHDEAEIDIALTCGSRIIGINNRDLNTFKTDLSVTWRLKPLIPSGTIVVSESGLHNRADMEVMRKIGINAVLIGEALTSSEDIGQKIRELSI